MYKSIFSEEKKEIELKDIGNLKELPKETQKYLYREIDFFEKLGNSQINGFKFKRDVMISLNGFWKGNKFYVKSYDGVDYNVAKKYNMNLEWENK